MRFRWGAQLSGRARFWKRGLLAAAGLLAFAPECAAESLLDAIRLAYDTNPTMRSRRAELRATNETYVQARAGYGVQASVSAQGEYQIASVQAPASFFTPATTTRYGAATGTVDVTVSQPLFTTGALRAQVRAAKAGVFAGRETLRQTESQMILDVVTAYEDVRRDRAILKVLQDEITALSADAGESQARGRLGLISKTDIALTDARLLSAKSELEQAQGRVAASSAEYLNVVGQNPGDLEPEPDLPGLPKTIDEAFDAADHNNAQLLGAIESERAARSKVDQAKSAYGPTVSLRIDAGVAPVEPYLPKQYDKSLTGAVVFNQPIFTSGALASKVRQAVDDDAQAELNVETARRGVVQLVSQAWAQWAASKGALQLETRQTAADEAAAKGSRIEERAGLRTTIDLLTAESELANTRIGLLQSRHDEYVARAALLSAMGLLEVRYLAPDLPVYRPERTIPAFASRVSAPGEAVAQTLDRVGPPATPAPKLSPTGAGDARPTDLPPVPPDAPLATDPSP